MNTSKEDLVEVESKPPPPLWRSCRLTLSIVCFFGLLHNFWLRLCFSIGIVCMTGTSNNDTDGGQAIEGEFDDWGPVIIANLLGGFYYGYVCTQMLGGFTSKKIGEKIPLTTSMVIVSVLSILIPVIARWHYIPLFILRILQGMSSGFTLPVIYSLFTAWSTHKDKATLLAIAFSGVSFANVVNYPVSGLLCYSDWNGGWPLVFYVPGISGLIWCAVYFFGTTNLPKDHPRISEEEKEYLEKYACRYVDNQDNIKRKIPWLKVFTSLPLHALWIAHLTTAWSFHLISLNIPLFVDQVFNLGIVYNGLVSAIPYVFVLFINFSAKLYDAINNRHIVETNTLRKIFNSLGSFGTALVFILMPYWTTSFSQIFLLTLAAGINQLSLRAGFMISHSDLVGPYAGVLFGFTNTMATIPGFITPLLVAALAPNGTQEEWQNVFYVSAGISAFGGIFYLIFGKNSRLEWIDNTKSEDQMKSESSIE